MVRVRMRRRNHRPWRLYTIILITVPIVLFSIHLILHHGRSADQGSHSQWVTAKSHPFNENNDISDANHLIMVAGHSVTISGHLQDAGEDETDWYLLDYQKGKGLPQAIVAHIREGIRQAAMDRKSILIFSGGETRPNAGPVNEGSSYFRVADAMKLWPQNINDAATNVRSRTTSEEFAVDSFENLLFSICRFYEVTGSYPTKITTISFSFKKKRFETLHAKALQWPLQNFHYIGIDPDKSTGFDVKSAAKGESENAAKPFEGDPYGCHTKLLQDKREGRNPFRRTAPYELTCPDMKDVLKWCGPELISVDNVPWK